MRHGLKLGGRGEAIEFTGLGARWMSLLRSIIQSDVMAGGYEYARSGQTTAMEVKAGAVTGHVQGSAPRPYVTIIQWPALTAEQWELAIQAMARESIHLAKLLAGELPANLDDVMAGLGMALLPASGDAIEFTCTCAEQHPCKHHACLAHLIAGRLTEAPLTIFAMLGQPSDRVIDRLRRARTIQEHGVASTHADAAIPETQLDPLPLEACIDEFWRGGTTIEDLESRPPAQHVSHALLRRLGPSPLNGKFPMVGLLASVYDTVSVAATRLRERAEQAADASATED